jgi:hypothetical protein
MKQHFLSTSCDKSNSLYANMIPLHTQNKNKINRIAFYEHRTQSKNSNLSSFTPIKNHKTKSKINVRRVKGPSNDFICHLWKLPNGTQHTTGWMNGRRRVKGDPPTTRANSAAARSSRPGVASRAPGARVAKIR